MQQVFRTECKCCLPQVDPFSLIEHLTDTPPTCLPLNSDSMWCLSSINIDRDTHVILRTGLTTWYYECCCWHLVFTFHFSFAVLYKYHKIKITMSACQMQNYFLYTPTSSEILNCYRNILLIWNNLYIYRFIIWYVSSILKVFFHLLHTHGFTTKLKSNECFVHTLKSSFSK